MSTSARTMDKPLDWYNRYARHIALEEVGESGQLALNAASVLVIGTGGLGSPVALYLTAAGVGTLGLVDFDTVSLNNLQRQILHGTSDQGRPKVQSAWETLREINPEVKVHLYQEKMTTANALDLVQEYDLVVDASDNFATRFLINDVCVQAGKPLVFGAVLQFAGQVTVFTQEEDCGCYRCLFPESPPPELVPTCEQAGIFGVTPGIIGSLQASQALLLILNSDGHTAGEILKNRLLIYDGKQASFREISLARNPECPVCGNPDFDLRKVEYTETCAVDAPPAVSISSRHTTTVPLADIG
ncbi:MAG: molybdopterin-synthase adenylyltransferase MoeB [Fidelibacterota bacterium]|nr:MAG: molybdopterin-synthase adenylyltransferase MoeB [Candidatus Neomarinimicrobiota bacterium]